MARLAWFTPLPPMRTGIAAYSAEVFPLLARHHGIDVFVSQPAPGAISAHDFVWKNLAHPYDLVVYQLGNSSAHDYMWAYLTRFPGLVVLHDGQLHHSRAKALLAYHREDEYRTEFHFSHPEAPRGIADLVVSNLAGSLFYHWPMLGVAVRSARLVAVHSARLKDDLAAEFGSTPVELIRMGVSDPRAAADPAGLAASEIRAELSLPPEAVVFAAIGGVTPEKRIRQAIRGLAAITPYAPGAHLMLVGEPADYYDPVVDARAFGVESRVRLTGHVRDEDFAAYLKAADVCLCQRWPTSRETSAAWLRCMAAGKATVRTDLVHTDEVSSLDPRTWMPVEPASPPSGLDPQVARQPACVSIDILDEDHSLALAMRRLARDGGLRDKLGRGARTWWEQTHTLEHMATDYARVIARALELPFPDLTILPAHLRADGTGLARALVASVDGSEGVLPWEERGQT